MHRSYADQVTTMDSRSSLGQLDLTADSTVKRLDQMLLQLDGYRPLLEQNVNYAEFDIKATFDSLIDALGQRQLQLLKQLEKIAKDKAGMIDSQKQILENLRSNIVSCMSSRHKNATQIQEYISRAESALLSSGSAPFVSFRTEKSVMHQTIAGYGRIVSQYCGHFADPSQPSSCLPRALEEEDENDESIDYGCNAQSMVFSHIHIPGSRIKPHLRQWLSDEHNIEKPKFTRTEPKKTSYSTISDVLTNYSGLPSQQPTPSHTTKVIGSQSSFVDQSSTVNVPRRICESLAVRDWLDMHSMNKAPDRSKEQGLRKLSQALSFGSSDGTRGTDSDSFIAISGSTGGLTNLKDWLFCDPIELTDIPGLSSATESQSLFAFPKTSVHGHTSGFSNWLLPASSAQTPITGQLAGLTLNEKHEPATVMRSPLLPSHLTQSGPVDLDRWLIRPNHSKETVIRGLNNSENLPVSTANSFASTEPAVEPLEKEDLPKVAVYEEPTDAQMVSTIDDPVPDCCIYSQCRGGPGGPTCCGARNFNKRVNNSVSVDKVVETPTINTSGITQPTPSKTEQNGSKYDTSADIHPVVAQFQSIVNTPLDQWLTESASALASVTSANYHSDTASREWLHPQDSLMADDGASEDTVIPSKRRSCAGSVDCSGSCTSCPRAGDKCVSSKGSIEAANLMDSKGSENLDRWLLKKLSAC